MTDKRILPMVIMSQKMNYRYKNYSSQPPPWQLRYQSETNVDYCRLPLGRTLQLPPAQPHPNSLRTAQTPEPHPKSLKELEKRVNTLEKSNKEKTNTCTFLTKKVQELEKRLLNLEKKIQEKDDDMDIDGACSSRSRSADLLQKATSVITKSKTENKRRYESALHDSMVELKLNDFRAAIRDERRAKTSTRVTEGFSTTNTSDAPELRSMPISTELLILPDVRHYSKVEEPIPEKHINSGTNNRRAENTHESDTTPVWRRGAGSINFYKPHQGKKEDKANWRATCKQWNSESIKNKHDDIMPEEARHLDDGGPKSMKPFEPGNKAKREDAEHMNDQKCEESNISEIKYPTEAEALEQGVELDKPFPSPFTFLGKDELNETVTKNVTCLAELYQCERKFKKIAVFSF